MSLRSIVDFFVDRVLRIGRLKRRKFGNHIMYLDSKDRGLGRVLLNKKPGSPEREAIFMKVLRQELEQGMTALDIGANIGYVTLAMAEAVGPTGRVYAIEPDPRNFRVLKKNIVANGYAGFVLPYQAGLSNVTGMSKFYVSDKSNLHSMAATKHSKRIIDIPVTTLDDFVKDKPCPNFMKMDIEGHEVEALEGMYNTLRDATTTVKILMEVHPMYYSEQHSLEKQLRRLFDIGFCTRYVESAGMARPDFFVKHGYEPQEVVYTDGFYRGLYTGVSNDHMLMAACHEHDQWIEELKRHSPKIVRSIMIEKVVETRLSS